MRTFVNAAHFLVHYVVLIFPSAVLGMTGDFALGYGEMISLATITMLAFGLLSLPVGFVVNTFGPERLLAAYFLLIGGASISVAFAASYFSLGAALLAVGAAASIYHPVGLTLIASATDQLGRDISVNGVCGNLGSALAAVVTASLTQAFGWRYAFILPGLAAIGFGTAYIAVCKPTRPPSNVASQLNMRNSMPVARPYAALVSVVAAILAGGITYNIVTIALPKMVDEHLGASQALWIAGTLTSLIFLVGAIMQLAAGRLIDRYTLPTLFILLATLQLGGLLMAWACTGPFALIGLALTMAAIYGQVVVDDAIVARFVPERRRGLAYGAAYALGFAVSALAIPLMGYLYSAGEGFTPVLALTAACGGALLLCAIGFSLSVGHRKGAIA